MNLLGELRRNASNAAAEVAGENGTPSHCDTRAKCNRRYSGSRSRSQSSGIMSVFVKRPRVCERNSGYVTFGPREINRNRRGTRRVERELILGRIAGYAIDARSNRCARYRYSPPIVEQSKRPFELALNYAFAQRFVSSDSRRVANRGSSS